jgi:XTP/dITP diphosphohydrolase
MTTPRLLLASTNPGKLEELYDLLKDAHLDLTDPARLGLFLEVVEDGANYAENAGLKAAAFARASALPALADDTGLEVDVIDGRPGLHSRRVAATDEARRRRLLAALAPHPRPWRACFRCAMALALPGEAVAISHGACSGEIQPVARGQGGFGYDPLFLVDGTTQTMAELSLREKNMRSHRARALRALLPSLLALFNPG